MADTTPFTIGADASCADGVCGEVSRVVVDPVARAVTHLVVEPKGRKGLGRLVPLDLVDAAGGEVRLRCTVAEFERLDSAEETQFLPGTRGYAFYGPEQVLSWPYSSLGGGASVAGETVTGFSETATLDTVPLGEVAVRRGERVHATDGEIGQVEGLEHLIHGAAHHRHVDRAPRQIVIGAAALLRVAYVLAVCVFQDGAAHGEVQDLPPVDIDHPDL